MKNIEYLEEFWRKHKLSGKITVTYLNGIISDDYLSDILFENGDKMHITDVIFDIESGLENDVFNQWMEYKRENDISLKEWIQIDNHYMSHHIDTSSVEEYYKEMNKILDEVKRGMNKVFETDIINDKEKEVE